MSSGPPIDIRERAATMSQIKNALINMMLRMELTGARVTGFVIGWRMADGNIVFNAQGVTPQEFVEAAKALEHNKGEILHDKPLGG